MNHFSIKKVDFFFTTYMRMRKTRVLTFLSFALKWNNWGAIGSVLFSLSTSSFLLFFKIFYARLYQHGKPGFPPFEVHLSDQLPESDERGWKAQLIHSWPIFLFDWSFFRDLRQKKSHTKKGSFMQCITGGPLWIPSTQWMKGGIWGRPAFYMKIQTKRKRVKPYLTE